jgi:hypothetical protein
MCGVISLFGLLTLLIAISGWIAVIIKGLHNFISIKEQGIPLSLKAFRPTWNVLAMWIGSWIMLILLGELGLIVKCYWWAA